MQRQLSLEYPQLKISILGVNETVAEVGNSTVTAGRDLPWLQDVDGNANGLSDVWHDLWDVTYRDVVILNGDGEQVDVYNLTVNNLADTDSFGELKDKLLRAAFVDQRPFRNPANAFDANGDQQVSEADAFAIRDEINAEGSRELEDPSSAVPVYCDPNADGWLTPLDVLWVVNHLHENDHTHGESLAGESLAGEENGRGGVVDGLALLNPLPTLQAAGPLAVSHAVTRFADPIVEPAQPERTPAWVDSQEVPVGSAVADQDRVLLSLMEESPGLFERPDLEDWLETQVGR